MFIKKTIDVIGVILNTIWLLFWSLVVLVLSPIPIIRHQIYKEINRLHFMARFLSHRPYDSSPWTIKQVTRNWRWLRWLTIFEADAWAKNNYSINRQVIDLNNYCWINSKLKPNKGNLLVSISILIVVAPIILPLMFIRWFRQIVYNSLARGIHSASHDAFNETVHQRWNLVRPFAFVAFDYDAIEDFRPDLITGIDFTDLVAKEYRTKSRKQHV